MELYLVRHGDAARNSPKNFNHVLNCPDPDLTDAGEAHARQLGQRLAQAPIQRIYTSDLRRAVHTAEILAEYNPAPVEVRGVLREINMGRLFLSSWEEIERDMPGYAARWHRHDSDLPYPGGECGADVIRRCMPLINEIVQNSQDRATDAPLDHDVQVDRGIAVERVAIVTHGGTIRSLLCAFLGIGPEKRFLFGAPLENCGLSVVRWDERRRIFLVHSVNDAAHLS
jgi:probable phosphoglycerate mutase